MADGSLVSFEAMLEEIFRAQGAVDSAGLAKRAVQRFQLAERDQKIYALRTKMSTAEIAQRFMITSRWVKQIVSQQTRLRRAGAQAPPPQHQGNEKPPG